MAARTMLTSTLSRARVTEMRFGVSHRKFLEALLLCPAGLTAEQVARLLGSPASLTYYRSIGKDLVDVGYAQKAPLARVSQHGRVPSIFQLTRKGSRLLEHEGVRIEHWYAPSEARALSYLFRSHALVIGDTVIALHKLSQAYPESLFIERVRHERELKRLPLVVTLTDGRKTRVVPDLVTELRIREPSGTRRRNLLFEIDRSTESRHQMNNKLSAWAALLTTNFAEVFGTRSAVIAFVATQGDEQVARRTRWTEHVLREELGRQDLGARFRFTGQSPADVTPEQFFLSPTWRVPYRSDSVPLIEGIEA